MNEKFFALISRMRYIGRWGLMRSTAPENLSEHTLEVAYLTHALIVLGNRRLGEDLDPGQGVLYALYHDCSEILTGDMPTPVKYGSAGLKDAYKEVEEQAAARLLKKLPEDLVPDYAACFRIPEAYAPYVKAADKLSAYIKCVEEVKAGNGEFRDAAAQARAALESFGLPEVDYFLETFMDSFSLTLDELK